jgi:hypothetical protein
MGGGAKTRTVGARACAKNVYNSLLDEVARKERAWRRAGGKRPSL